MRHRRRIESPTANRPSCAKIRVHAHCSRSRVLLNARQRHDRRRSGSRQCADQASAMQLCMGRRTSAMVRTPMQFHGGAKRRSRSLERRWTRDTDQSLGSLCPRSCATSSYSSAPSRDPCFCLLTTTGDA